MNQLSWLLYWGNVFGNLGPCFLILGIGLGIATIVRLILYYGMFSEVKDEYKYLRNPDGSQRDKMAKAFMFPGRAIYTMIFFIFVSWTLAALCPSSTTVYAIAASQIGEKALQTPLAGKAGAALEAWLDRQISQAQSTTESSSSNKSN